MLSMKSLGAADSELAGYYESLVHEDYYETGGEPPGRWFGRLAGDLDLYGTVRTGQLGAVFRGQHPLTQQALATNAGEAHKAGWDLTFSAPKSVSLVWAIEDQPTQTAIAHAHAAAVQRALAYLELRAFSSRDRHDAKAGRGALLAAVFEHGTSREMDPQLHSHAVVANLGKRVDGSWCALDFDTRWKMAAGAIYRAELADQLKALGYGIERDGSSFRIAGVDKGMSDAFSTRRRQIVEALEQTGFTGAKAASLAALSTRQTKQEVDRKQLMPAWREQAAEVGLDADRMAGLRSPLQQTPVQETIEIDDILQSLTYSASTFTRMQLEAAMATEAQGRLNADAIVRKIAETLAERQHDTGPLGLVRLRAQTADTDTRRENGIERFTTREMLQIEKSIIEGAVGRKNGKRHQVSAAPGLVNHPVLSVEQIHALQHVTETEGAVSVIRGLAGTGKSMLLAAAKDSWETGGLNVIGAALAGKAADNLEQGSGIHSQTLHGLLAEIEGGHRTLTDRDVVVIDEAGMVGSRQLKRILDQVNDAGAKAVLVGDPRQLQPIEAGGMFRFLSDRIGYAELTDIRRQEKTEDRAMIGHLINGEAREVLEDLKKRDMLVTSPECDLHAAVVNAWAQARIPENSTSALMLAGTRSDVYRLNILAREGLKAVHQPHSATTVETDRGPREFAIGERMMFMRNSKQLGVKNGQTGTLIAWSLDSKGEIRYTIDVDGGRRVTVNFSQYKHLEYGYALSVHKAQGQTVDNVFLLMSEAMVDQEWSYVAASRHRKELHVFVAAEQVEFIEQQMARSQQKCVAMGYEDETECEEM